MLKLKVILGSTREGRLSEKLLPWVLEQINKKKGAFEIEVLDLRDYDMPFYNLPASPSMQKKGEYGPDAVRAWSKKIDEADAFVFITPEYTHGYTAVLKNALDWLYTEWNKKPVGFVGYGGVGGARAIEQLREAVVELQMASVRSAVHFERHWEHLEDGQFKVSALAPHEAGAASMLEQLSWWGEALKAARAKG